MVTRDNILNVLRAIDEPEMPISIVDLGIVEKIEILPSPPGRGAGGEGPPKRQLHHPPLPADLLEFVRKLRREQTDAENLMWGLLRNRRLACRKFRRQY